MTECTRPNLRKTSFYCKGLRNNFPNANGNIEWVARKIGLMKYVHDHC